MAFQKLSLAQSNIFKNILTSKFIGFENFKFFFNSADAVLITRNTIVYNIVFMALGLVAAVFIAIAANEIYSRLATKFYQTTLILPAFLSWVIVSYLLYSLLEPNFGAVNGALADLGIQGPNWYNESKFWPFILPILNLWKGVGLGSIYYFAAINGIDQEMYESAWLDGASRFKQIIHITIPCLKTTMIILTILSMGSIIKTDFGLFHVSTLAMGRGLLFNVASTIDTYVYSTIQKGKYSLGTAIGLFQSVVGCIMIVGVNAIVRKIDKDSAMF
jgi:putative aldouronate transport system permease protein